MVQMAGVKPATMFPMSLHARSVLAKAMIVVAGTFLLALSSWISVPITPIPFTLQTYVVGMAGLLLGWRMAGVTIALWLLLAAVGLPVLSGYRSGLDAFTSVRAGYLYAFPAMGMMVGALAQRGWNGQTMFLAMAGMLMGHVLCLGMGSAWLATYVGWSRAITAGVIPFLGPAVIKSIFAAISITLLERYFSR